MKRPRQILPEPIIEGEIARIQLSDGQFALVDTADIDLVRHEFWSPSKYLDTFYATNKTARMHQRIFGNPPRPELEIDHIDGNGLNNRRSNLRWATRSQNSANGRPRSGTSRFKGVSYSRETGLWKANITHNGRLHHLGYFVQEEAAARAYDVAASSFYGEFARPNFPHSHFPIP